MKYLLLISVLFSPSSYSQEPIHSGGSIVANQRFYLGVNLSPDACFRTLRNNEKDNPNVSIVIDSRNSNEQYKLSYSTGIFGGYQLSKHFGVELGVQYSNKGYKERIADLVFGDMTDPRFDFIYQTQPGYTDFVKFYSGEYQPTLTFIYNYYYLDVPVCFAFKTGDARAYFIAHAGFSINFLLETDRTEIVEPGDGFTYLKTDKKPFDFNKINLSPFLSLGLGYRLSNKINLELEPTFRYGLLPIKKSPINEYLWNAGINIGFTYSW